MENLDTYKTDLKRKLILYRIFVVIGFLILFIGNVFLKEKVYIGPDYVTGMASGFCLGLMLVLSFRAGKISKALKDEKLLRKMYIKDTDEREKFIREKAGYPLVLILSVAVFLAGLFAGFISEPIFVTLISVGLVQLLISLIVKIYWKNKI